LRSGAIPFRWALISREYEESNEVVSDVECEGGEEGNERGYPPGSREGSTGKNEAGYDMNKDDANDWSDLEADGIPSEPGFRQGKSKSEDAPYDERTDDRKALVLEAKYAVADQEEVFGNFLDEHSEKEGKEDGERKTCTAYWKWRDRSGVRKSEQTEHKELNDERESSCEKTEYDSKRHNLSISNF
jgi:hypothetical protein